MYKQLDKSQQSFLDFNQPMGLQMNPSNRWVKMEAMVPWKEFEEKYAELFPSNTGNVAKPLQMALGALIIQTKYSFSDRELVEQITENPYFQFFIGLPGYQQEKPFDASALVAFRKRITAEILMEVNEYFLKDHDDDHHDSCNGSEDTGKNLLSQKEDNEGTLILDATCAPVNIRYPQDVSLLNESREKLETIIQRFCKSYDIKLPRRYRRRARKDYLAYAKSRKHTAQKTRKAIRKQLGYVRRDLEYIKGFLEKGYEAEPKEMQLYLVIQELYRQQKEMYDNKTHSVEHRIVSISQSWIRPIVRGKVKSPTEFGPKLDLSVDEKGYARIEKISFEAYNESTCLQEAVERYREREGRYPKRVLADKIYRTRDNRKYCKIRGIRLSGPRLGRPQEDQKLQRKEKQIEYQDNTDRIEVEREFSLAKRCYHLGKIVAKLEETQMTSVALSVFVMNLFKKAKRIFCAFFEMYYFMDRRRVAIWLY